MGIFRRKKQPVLITSDGGDGRENTDSRGRVLEERIIENSKDIQAIKKEIETLKIRLSKQGEAADGFKTDIELIKQATSYTEEMLKEIKDDIKVIRKEREQDHYIKPLENNAKFIWQVVAVVIALLVGFLLKSLFPTIIM